MAQTTDQLRQLASFFSGMSATVDEYRNQHFEQLAPEERLRLEQLFQQFCDIHDEFTALAVGDTLEGIASDIDTIVSVTGEAERSLRHLTKIAEISNILAATAELAADITSADYGAIPRAIQTLTEALPKKSTEAPPAGKIS